MQLEEFNDQWVQGRVEPLGNISCHFTYVTLTVCACVFSCFLLICWPLFTSSAFSYSSTRWIKLPLSLLLYAVTLPSMMCALTSLWFIVSKFSTHLVLGIKGSKGDRTFQIVKQTHLLEQPWQPHFIIILNVLFLKYCQVWVKWNVHLYLSLGRGVWINGQSHGSLSKVTAAKVKPSYSQGSSWFISSGLKHHNVLELFRLSSAFHLA